MTNALYQSAHIACNVFATLACYDGVNVLKKVETMSEYKQYDIQMIDFIGHGIWDWNIATNEIFFSPQWKKMLGYQPDEINDTIDAWSSRVHPDDFTQCLNELAALFSGKIEHYRCEHRMLCKNGHYKWILAQGGVIARNEEDSPLRVVGTHTDIDDLRRALEAQN